MNPEYLKELRKEFLEVYCIPFCGPVISFETFVRKTMIENGFRDIEKAINDQE